MTQIVSRFSPTDTFGIGTHHLVFVDYRADDPGLNAGERAYLLGRGYRFAEGGVVSGAESPAAAPKPKRAARTRKSPVDTAAAVTAPAADTQE